MGSASHVRARNTFIRHGALGTLRARAYLDPVLAKRCTEGASPFRLPPARRSQSVPLCRSASPGTGWLGWPPSEVWNASTAELEAAVLAHFDRLVLMTPGADAPKGDAKEAQRQANIAAGLDPDFDREGLCALKARHSA